MALTCEIMIDEIFVLFENSGKYFPDYNSAYFYGRNLPVSNRTVKYVFTPTMVSYKTVKELENAYRQYMNHTTGCDYFNLFTKEGSKQLKLIGE